MKLSLLVQALDERAKDIREWGVRDQDTKTVAGLLEDARDALASQPVRYDADALKRLVGLADSLGGKDEDTIMEAVAALAQQAQPECEHGEIGPHRHDRLFGRVESCPGPTQQAQPEMPTREMIEETRTFELYGQVYVLRSDVLALFAQKDAWPMYCASCDGPYGHPEPCGA